MGHFLFRNPGNPNRRPPTIFPGTGTDVPDPLNSLEGAWPVNEMLQGIADQRIPDGDAEEGDHDPGFDPWLRGQQKDQGHAQKDRCPEPAVSQKIEKLIQPRVVESTIHPTENPQVQRINLGDQFSEAKLSIMERQAVCVVLFLCLLSWGWGQNRNPTEAKSTPVHSANSKTVSDDEITPTPRQMQNFLWRTLVMKDLRMKGQVQSGAKKIPLLIRAKERLLQFEFQDRPLQIRVRFAPEGSLIQKRSKAEDEWQVVTGVEKTKAVAGTDLAFEDLGIDFLRWPDPQPKGEDNVMMLDCWVYEVTPPVESNYAKVRYWISKGYKAMIRADGLNNQGQAIKRFTFNSVIETDDTVVVGEMKVAKLTPGTDVSASRTFVQVESVEKGSGL